MTTRVLIADDHPIVRSGIRNELSRHQDLEVVGEALNGDETLHKVLDLQPDILLLDIHMPGKRAIDVVNEIKGQDCDCHILILSAHGDTPTIIGMLKAGVEAYILKDEDPLVLPEAIHTVLLGDTWLSPGVSDKLTSIMSSIDGGSKALTKRELQVLLSLSSGGTNREIAASLQMSERTVEFHVTNILRKLGVKGRLEAAMKAKEQGIL